MTEFVCRHCAASFSSSGTRFTHIKAEHLGMNRPGAEALAAQNEVEQFRLDLEEVIKTARYEGFVKGMQTAIDDIEVAARDEDSVWGTGPRVAAQNLAKHLAGSLRQTLKDVEAQQP